MEVNNIDNFTSGLKDFYFSVLGDLFPLITREEFDKLFDEVIELERIDNERN